MKMSCLNILFLECTEEFSTAFTAWVAHVSADHSIDLSRWVKVELVGTDHWCDVPNMLECYTREVTTPTTGNEDTTESSSNDITKCFPEVETFVRELPYTVDTMCVIRLTNQLLITHLQVIVKIVWISVSQIRISSPGISNNSHVCEYSTTT